MEKKIIYHQFSNPDNSKYDCLDGRVAAWIASKVYPEASLIGCIDAFIREEVEIIDLPPAQPKDTLIILDMCFPKEILQKWLDMKCELIIIDHHIQNRNSLENLPLADVRFSLLNSAVILTWDYFFPSKVCPLFLRYIEDCDLFRFSLPLSRDIIEGIKWMIRRSTNWGLSDFKIFEYLESMGDKDFIETIGAIGKAVIQNRNDGNTSLL